MLSRIPFAIMMDLAEVDAVLQKMGEGTIGEGDAATKFRDLGVAPFGDDAALVEILD